MPSIKKVKILATLGPASNTPETIAALLRAGADGFRINFSHGTHEFHLRTLQAIGKAARTTKIQPSILADLQGPKIRTGATPDNAPVLLRKGSEVILVNKRVEGSASVIPVEYPRLLQDIQTGHEILLNDGAVRIRVTARDAKREALRGEVLNDGVYSSRKGVNFPGIALSITSFTPKDKRDLAFILTQDIHYIALSFVRAAADLKPVLRAVSSSPHPPKVIAKIEKPEAAENIGAIVDACDGIMVARGDLGVETSITTIPVLQKQLIEIANERGKTVIVATQMLESMITNPSPTRAEATDVANAVFDGTDVIMLSGETAVGAYPVETVKTMSAIACEAECSRWVDTDMVDLGLRDGYPPHAVCEAAVWASRDLGCAPVVVFTVSGNTALYLSKIRCQAPIYAFTPDLSVKAMLNLAWNVRPFHLALGADPAALQSKAEQILIGQGLVRRGDLLLVVSGTTSARGATNSLRIKKVGEE